MADAERDLFDDDENPSEEDAPSTEAFQSDDDFPPDPEPEPTPQAAPPEQKRSPLRVAFLVVGVLVIILGLCRVVGGMLLESKRSALATAIGEWRAKLDPKRRAHFDPAASGNAADEYRAAEWNMGFRASRLPSMPDPYLLLDWEKTAPGDPVPEKVQPALDYYARAARHIRNGLAMETCEWKFRVEDAPTEDVPSTLGLRTAACILAWEAHVASPDDALHIGLEIVAFGRDVARHPSALGLVGGAAILDMGSEVVLRALRKGPSPESLQRALEILAGVSHLDTALAAEGECLWMQAVMGNVSGHRVTASGSIPLLGSVPGISSVYWFWEWRSYQSTADRVVPQLSLPYTDRKPKHEEFLKEVETSLNVASLAMPDLFALADVVDRSNVLLDATRVLVAAQLHRRDAGRFPASILELKPRLGNSIPPDPFAKDAGATLRLAQKGKDLCCYSVGPDQEDGGGDLQAKNDGKAPDVGYLTTAP